jgi:hypothetical protein
MSLSKYTDGKIYACVTEISSRFKIDKKKVIDVLSKTYPEIKSRKLLNRDLDLVYRFIQPFDPVNDADFINFTRSDNLRLIYSKTKGVTSEPNKTWSFIDNISKNSNIDTNSIAILNMYFLAYNSDGLKKLIEKYAYLNTLLEYTKAAKYMKFAFSVECFDKLHRFNSDTVCDKLSKINKNEIAALKVFLKNKKIKLIRIHLNFVVNSEVTDDIIFSDKTTVAHSSQLILNISDNKAYILESSVNDPDDILLSQQLETVKDISIQLFLKHYIDENIILEPLDLSICPAVKLQGSTGLCGTWSLYLFVLTILNPGVDRATMYEVFSQYSQNQRDILIMMFMYWIFKYDKYNGINYSGSLLEGKLPQLNAL